MATSGKGAVDVEFDFALLYRESAVPALVIDVVGRRVLDVNPATEAFLGFDRAQIIGRPGADFLSEPTHDELLRVRSLRGDTTITVRNVTTDFGIKTCELKIVPTADDGTIFVQVVDITDVLAEAARAHAQAERAERVRESLETVVSQVAHDLQSPLVAIAGFADLLVTHRDSLTDEQQHDMLERIANSAHAMAAHASELVESAGQRDRVAANAPRTAEDLCRNVEAMCEAQLSAVDGCLSFTGLDVELPVPVSRLSPVLVNLVSNSIKYATPGQAPSIAVAVERTDDPAGIAIEVTDDGPGFPGDPEALFAVGARGDGLASVPGSGLGLSFVRGAVEGMGGTVVGGAGPRGGALVRIDLPDEPIERPRTKPSGFRSGLSAEQLDRIIEVSPVATVVVDLSLRQIVRVNAASAELLGLPVDAIVGRAGADFVAERALADALRDETMNTTGTTEAFLRVRTASGMRSCRVVGSSVPLTALAVFQILPR